MKRLLYPFTVLYLLLAQVQPVESQEIISVSVADKGVITVVIETSGNVSSPQDIINIPSQVSANWRINGIQPLSVGRYTYVWYEGMSVGSSYAITLRHHLYLKLGYDLVNGSSYTVISPDNETIVLEFDDKSTLCEAIHVNQVGYFGGSSVRYANMGIYLGDMGTRKMTTIPNYSVLDDSGDIVLSGQLEYRGFFNDSGEEVYRIDLAGLIDGGPYTISVDGYGVSHPFGVGADYIGKSNFVHLRGLYHQRCGMALEEPYTEFTRGLCHSTVEVTDAEPPDFITARGVSRSISGGYHDAGDFDRRQPHTIIPAHMLTTYEAFPGGFTDGQFNLPESGNGIPDWLDECLWGLKIWEELQEPNGGIRAGTESDRHPQFGTYYATTDPYVYRTYRIDGHATASGVGLFAQASRLVRPFDNSKADELLSSALLSWTYLQANSMPSAHPGQKMYAALQMYLATGDQVYHNAFKTYANSALSGSSYNPVWWNLNTIVGGQVLEPYFFSYLITDLPVDATLKNSLLNMLSNRATEMMNAVRNAPYPIGAPPNLNWGTATNQGRYANPLMLMYRLNSNNDYLDAISQLSDYSLGLNPLGKSYVTGLGANPPNNLCHADSYHQFHKGKGNVPGIVVYGPCEGLSGADYQKIVYGKVYPAITSMPKQRKYTDGWTFINATEFTTWETMALNVCMYGFLDSYTITNLPSDPPSLPSGFASSAISSSRIELSWTDNSDDENGFIIERKTGEDGIYAVCATVGSDIVVYIDTKLTHLTKYYYRIRAYNSAGYSAYSEVVNATTLDLPPAPLAPGNLVIDKITTNQIDLSWLDNSDNEDGFAIERKTGGAGNFIQVATFAPGTKTYSMTGLAHSITYSFRVVAYNDGGYSDYSNEVTASTEVAYFYNSIDIGTSTAGTTTDVGGVITIQGSGSGLGSTSDSFRYICQEGLSGQFELIARLDAFTATNSNALAGLMIRQGTQPNDFFYTICVSQGKIITGKYRNNVEWIYTGTVAGTVNMPIWLRITKGPSPNNVLTTYTSTNGVNWTQRWQDWFQAKLEEPCTAGLVVTSNQDGSFGTANFSNINWPGEEPLPNNILYTSAENGSISLFPEGGVYAEGTVVSLSAIPDNNFNFDTWGGDLSGTMNPTTITMNGDKSVTAAFSENVYYSVTLSDRENGSISLIPPGGTYLDGTVVTVVGLPDNNYIFEAWNGDLSGNQNPTTLQVDANKSIGAIFSLLTSINNLNRGVNNRLDQNYPNPFGQFTHIPYHMESPGDVEIRIVDIIGRTVWSTSLKNQKAGDHILLWSTGDGKGTEIGDGIYFYRIRILHPNGTFIDERKMIIAK